MGKIGAVLVSHGQLGNELLAAAETVIGQQPDIRAVSIDWHDDVEVAKAQIARSIEEVSDGNGVVVLTDMFGGTPTNIAAMFLKPGEVEIVTGASLPMIVKAATLDNELPLAEFAQRIVDEGKAAIYRAAELLEPQKLKKDA
jgi:PTS system mannose-specific IIA component